VFATNSFLELGGDEWDNLNFMNFKMTVLKFVEIREFWEILKLVKFEFPIYDATAEPISTKSE